MRTPEQRERRDNAVRFVVAMVGVVTLVSFCILYTAYSQREADKRWCALIGGFDDRYRQLQTEDPAAKELAGELRKLRVELKCPVSPFPQVTPSPSISPVRSTG